MNVVTRHADCVEHLRLAIGVVHQVEMQSHLARRSLGDRIERDFGRIEPRRTRGEIGYVAVAAVRLRDIVVPGLRGGREVAEIIGEGQHLVLDAEARIGADLEHHVLVCIGLRRIHDRGVVRAIGERVLVGGAVQIQQQIILEPRRGRFEYAIAVGVDEVVVRQQAVQRTDIAADERALVRCNVGEREVALADRPVRRLDVVSAQQKIPCVIDQAAEHAR